MASRLVLVALTASLGASSCAAEINDSATVAAPFSHSLGQACAASSDCPSLACVHGVCDYCRPGHFDCGDYPGDISKRCQLLFTESEDTGEASPIYSLDAKNEQVQATYCVEKDLFEPFGWNDLAGTLVAFFSTAVGSGCGIGGGGLMVPLFIFIMGLSPKLAIPLSKASIFGNAIAIYLFNFNRRHPSHPNVPIINYAVAAVMEPMTLVGTVFGVMLNKTLPTWAILVLLIALLSTITYKTASKGFKLRERESKEQQKRVKAALTGSPESSRWSVFPRFEVAAAARRWLNVTRRNRKARETHQKDLEDFQTLPPLVNNHHQAAEEQSLLASQGHGNQPSFGTFERAPADDDVWASTRHSIQERDARRTPFNYIWPLVVSWLVILAQAFLRGGHGAPSVIGVPCGSDGYWVLTLLPLLMLVAITAYMGRKLRLLNRLKVLSGYAFDEGDIHWIRYRVVALPGLCIIAGIAAGLLGVGGGMVKGPIMLEMGILPAVQSATTSYMILFTSSSTTLQFAINGQFPGEKQYDYALWFICVGFFGGLTGQYVVAMLVKRFKRESIIVFLMAATIGLSAVAMSLVSFQSTLADVERGVHLGFNGLCDAA